MTAHHAWPEQFRRARAAPLGRASRGAARAGGAALGDTGEFEGHVIFPITGFASAARTE
ncbi:hypothetical protein [Streptomyces sp. NPDC014894]|uniref:hypothetical protein n=1 Tax=Streptomyces sp. NPDC014894 TaxID=3364931 RepID=UPI0036F6A1B5